jgi:hypothetical protein
MQIHSDSLRSPVICGVRHNQNRLFAVEKRFVLSAEMTTEVFLSRQAIKPNEHRPFPYVLSEETQDRMFDSRVGPYASPDRSRRGNGRHSFTSCFRVHHLDLPQESLPNQSAHLTFVRLRLTRPVASGVV